MDLCIGISVLLRGEWAHGLGLEVGRATRTTKSLGVITRVFRNADGSVDGFHAIHSSQPRHARHSYV